jgi:hypothetical protein
MDQPGKPRDSWNNILVGFLIVLLGLSFCAGGITALTTGIVLFTGIWKEGPMSGEQALISGILIVAGGCFWLWTCFRKKR